MKSILLPVDQSEQMPSALETAWQLANLFEGTVEGVALRPAFANVAPDPIVAVTIPPADWNEADLYARCARGSMLSPRPLPRQGQAPACAGAAGRPSKTVRWVAWPVCMTSRF